MSMRTRFEGLAGAAARRPLLTIAVVVALALAGGLLSLGLKPSAGTDTFVRSSSASYQATAADQRHFGDDSVIILIKEPLTDLVETKDLATITELEACLAGQFVTANVKLLAFTPSPSHAPYGGWQSPCGKLMKAQPAKVVYGPGTFLNQAVAAVNTEIGGLTKGLTQSVKVIEASTFRVARAKGYSNKRALAVATAAGQLEYTQQVQKLETLALDSGITSLPSIDSPQFIPSVVFDQTRGVNQPKARFAYLFPTTELGPDPGPAEVLAQRRPAGAGDLADPAGDQDADVPLCLRRHLHRHRRAGGRQRPRHRDHRLDLRLADRGAAGHGGDAADRVPLAATARRRSGRRVIRLPAVAAAGDRAGRGRDHVRAAGGARRHADHGLDRRPADPDRTCRRLRDPVPGPRRGGPIGRSRDGGAPLSAERAVAQAAGRAAPTLATAALATATGFLVLLLSPVPMVQGFGLLLVVGIAVALACALTAGSAALVLSARDGSSLAARRCRARPGDAARGCPRALAASLRGATEIVAGAWHGAGDSSAHPCAGHARSCSARAAGPRRRPGASAGWDGWSWR